MQKRIDYPGYTDAGIFCQSLFGSAGAFEKRAGAPAFADWPTGEKIRKYISGISKTDRKNNCYILVNALGAGEYFGSNINADFFPWNSLAHDGDDYGYRTFLNAHAFQHHQNKDPTRAFGVPVLSMLNPQMKRVELIVRLDRAKAKAEAADGIISRIDSGEFPDVSMGCKVPWDLCSICGNKSKNSEDYCVHMRPTPDKLGVFGPNKILPDGRRIFVYNIFPRFFDISFVFIGADKTAKTMAKLAQVGHRVCLGPICTLPGDHPEPAASARTSFTGGVEKTASVKKDCACGCDNCDPNEKLAEGFGVRLASKKMAELIKRVPTEPGNLTKLTEIEKSEPTIPTPILDEMAQHGVGACCSTAGSLGMILKPREFQRVVLVRMGEGGLADDLDAKGSIFRSVPNFDDSVPYDPQLIVEAIVRLLAALVPGRTAVGPHFTLRLHRGPDTKNALPTESRVADSLLDKISAAYNGYRRSSLIKMSQALDVVQSDPRVRELVLGNNLVSMFMKTASAPIASLDSVAYMMGAHLEDRGLLHTTAVDAMVANNKWMADIHAAERS